MISMSYQKLAVDLKPGNTILCSDGTITLTVLSCDAVGGTVRCRCENTAMLGERKNVNLPGVVVDLPTLTDKDKEDILDWGVPNSIDMIALSFVRKGSDLVNVRKVLGPHSKHIKLMSKVCIVLPVPVLILFIYNDNYHHLLLLMVRQSWIVLDIACGCLTTLLFRLGIVHFHRGNQYYTTKCIRSCSAGFDLVLSALRNPYFVVASMYACFVHKSFGFFV